MASYALNVTFRGQKLTRQVTAASQDIYTVSCPSTSPVPFNIQMVGSTTPLLYHSAAGLVTTDGYPIAAGTPFTIQVGNGTVFYIASTGAGTIDFVVL